MTTDLKTMQHRLKSLEAKMAQERFILTESQIAAKIVPPPNETEYFRIEVYARSRGLFQAV